MKKNSLVVVAVGLIVAWACQLTAEDKKPTTKADIKATTEKVAEIAKENHEPMPPMVGVAVVMPTKDHKAEGTLVFTQTSTGVEVTGEITGLSPGMHGFHIHEFGDVRAADGMSAGGHFNPEKSMHGDPAHGEHHAGDLGNIKADGMGKAVVKTEAKGVKLHFILGRSIVIHAKEDDLKTQPTGESGGRVGVGVIGSAQVKTAAK